MKIIQENNTDLKIFVSQLNTDCKIFSGVSRGAGAELRAQDCAQADPGEAAPQEVSAARREARGVRQRRLRPARGPAPRHLWRLRLEARPEIDHIKKLPGIIDQ